MLKQNCKALVTKHILVCDHSEYEVVTQKLTYTDFIIIVPLYEVNLQRPILDKTVYAVDNCSIHQSLLQSVLLQ
jgi:hypothetical protein